MRVRLVGLVLAFTLCVGVGSAQAASSWRIEEVPSPVVFDFPTLLDVSCWSDQHCMAVGGTGFFDFIDYGVAIAVERTPNGWHLRSVRTGSELGSYLDGISCPAAGDCLAVGVGDAAGYNTPLLEQFSGGAWHLLPPPAGMGNQTLLSVSCPSTTWCMAVGAGATDDALTFDGTRWSLAPDTPSGFFPDGVSCPSANACDVAGFRFTDDGLGEVPADVHWNGSSWTQQPTATPTNSALSGFAGVSCSSASFCAAVGARGDAYAFQSAFSEIWDGTSWTIQPTGGSYGSHLFAASCVSATSCRAVGYTPEGADILRWTGSGWQREANPGSLDGAELFGVSCPTAASCTVVGAGPPGGDFVEHYGPSAVGTVTGSSARARGRRHWSRHRLRRPF